MGIKFDEANQMSYDHKSMDRILKSYLLQKQSALELAKEFDIDIDLVEKWSQEFMQFLSNMVSKNNDNEIEDVSKPRVKNDKVIQYIIELYDSI
ncbi:MAG: hypothetical protein LBT38_02865 [Deltaproteobacteria bacterium]|jgi:hypothetical protein|nr:hypothetical protein [Deltaproteobacteria bacterium]